MTFFSTHFLSVKRNLCKFVHQLYIKMSKKKTNTPLKANARTTKHVEAKTPRKPFLIPVLPALFVAVWAWATFYYGDVFRITRENSFWVSDTREMNFILNQDYGIIRYVGRMLLMLFRYPWLGGLCLAFMATLCTWFTSIIFGFKSRWRWISLLPVGIYLLSICYAGLNIYFERETGMVLGIPVTIVAILGILALLRWLFSRTNVLKLLFIPDDESPLGNRLQLLGIIVIVGLSIGYVQWKQPYVRVINKMIRQTIEQDWYGVEETARAHADMSNRPMAAFYAVALVHTNQIADRLYDIRLDYDTLNVTGWDKTYNNGNSIYISDCSYHGGFVQTAYHNCMERAVMSGFTIHGMEIMTKCALMRSEWELANKYLRILRDVPFEGQFYKKYKKMVYNAELVNSDPEMAHIRLLEPIHDSFESVYQQPVFLGYNLRLYEGRSVNALYNSLAVCLYTKVMPDFMSRLEPIAGQTPPENVMDGILLMSNKNPNLLKAFNGLDFRMNRLSNYMNEIKPYMADRPGNARKLFNKYKGYYPYYYFFGNLRATKKREPETSTSSSGVN